MRLEKREITLNEKDSLKDLFLLEKALLGQYTDTLTQVNRKELRERILDLIKETAYVEPKTVFLLSCRGKYAIRKRPETGLLAKLWEFPNTEGTLSEEEAGSHLCALGLSPVGISPCGESIHIFTHIEWHMTGYASECLYPSEAFVWKSAEEILSDYAIPSAFRAYISYIKNEKKGS